MAVRETLELNLRGALAQLDTLERQIDDLRRPVNLDLDVTGDAAQEISTIDARLENIVTETQDVNRELRQMEDAAARSVDDFSNIARQLGITEERARDIAREVGEAERAASRLDAEVKDVARAMGISEKAAAQLVTELRQAERAAKDIGDAKGPSRLVGVFQGAAVAATAAAVGIGLGAKAALNAIEQFSNLQEATSKAQVVFGVFADDIIRFAEDAPTALGQTQQAAIEAAATFGNLFLGIGFGQKAAADLSTDLVELATDLASFNNIGVDEAMEKLRAGLVGETEPLRPLGVLLSEAAVQAKALELGLGGVTGTLSEAEKVQARYAIIMEKTTTAQGDFARTSEGLANLQRTATAGVTALATAFGESLAPALEAILAQAPGILDLFASLNPALAETAGKAATAAAGMQVLAANLVLGPKVGADIAGELGDVAQASIGFFEDLSDAIRFGDRDFSHFRTQMDQFTQKEAQRFIDMAGLRIPKAIREGITPINALGQAIAGLALRDDDLHALEEGFEQLRIQSGLTEEASLPLIRTLLDQAEALELNADEVSFLEGKHRDYSDALQDSGRANADYLASIQAIADTDTFQTVTTRFATFTSTLAEIPAQMVTIQTATKTAADALGQSLNPFDEAPEDIQLSARQFFQRVTEEINREAEFQAGIVELTIRGHFDLARMLGEQGPAAQQALTGFLKNNVIAGATDAALKTGTTEESEAWGNWVEEQIANMEPGPAQQALIDLMADGIIDSPEVEEGIVGATRRMANTTVNTYAEQLVEELEALEPSAFQEALSGLFSGVTFDIDASQFNFPDSGAFQGTIGVGAVFTGSGGGSTVNVTNIINNPTPTDLPTNVAQANQSTAAVGSLLNRAVNS